MGALFSDACDKALYTTTAYSNEGLLTLHRNVNTAWDGSHAKVNSTVWRFLKQLQTSHLGALAAVHNL